MIDEKHLSREMTKVLGERINSVVSVGQGLAGPQFIVQSSKRKCFLKIASTTNSEVFALEALGLEALLRANELRVPKVYGYTHRNLVFRIYPITSE